VGQTFQSATWTG